LKAIGSRLTWPYYLRRVDHKGKMSNRRQIMDIGKYSFVTKSIRLGNQLLAEILGPLPYKANTFRNGVRKVINVVN
jgi:hypothetical protein